MDGFFDFISFVVLLFLIFIMGFVYNEPNSEQLDACAIEHNVYECEVQFVPVTNPVEKTE